MGLLEAFGEGGGGDGSRPASCYEAVVRDAPATVDDMMTVTSRSLDGGRTVIGPCPWMPRGVDLPLEGDRALVTFTDEEEAWVIAWWPGD